MGCATIVGPTLARRCRSRPWRRGAGRWRWPWTGSTAMSPAYRDGVGGRSPLDMEMDAALLWCSAERDDPCLRRVGPGDRPDAVRLRGGEGERLRGCAARCTRRSGSSTIAATQGIVLVVAAAQITPRWTTYALLIAALAALTWSFTRDVGRLWRARPAGGRVVCRRSFQNRRRRRGGRAGGACDPAEVRFRSPAAAHRPPARQAYVDDGRLARLARSSSAGVGGDRPGRRTSKRSLA